MAKKPEDRPASAQEVVEILRELEQRPHTEFPPKPQLRPARNNRKLLQAVACAALVVGLALAVVLWPTPHGTVRIESDDPAVQVVFDKDGVTIQGADKDQITLRAGEHGVLIKRGDFAFEADKLVLKKGATLTLKVELLQGKIQVLRDSKAVATQDMPVPVPSPARAPFSADQARDYQKAWAKYLRVPFVTTNPLGMKFRLIPPGEFTMGVTEAEAESWSKLRGDYVADGNRSVPAHTVRLTRPFYISEREVRYRDFTDLVKHEPGHEPKNPDNEPDGVLQTRCTWFDCIEFCNLLSDREGLSPAYTVSGHKVTVNRGATGYRLPTEAEWEFACRAGTTSLWYFGLTAQEAEAMCARSLPKAQSYLRVQSGKSNPFGLLGMYASSAEWCWDWYSPEYYRDCADRDVVVDPQGPESGTTRIVRGGTAYATASGDLVTINSAVRDPQDPIQPAGVNGFGRLVLPIPEKATAGSAPPAPPH